MRARPNNRTGKNSARVAICIATYRRADLLRDLLASLAQLRFEKVQAPTTEIFVVDNDESRGAEAICDVREFPWAIHYFCENHRGIASARNRAIAESTGAEFLAFIDDDETPATGWLDELLWAQAKFQGDVVSGPVIPAYVGDIPLWVRDGGFFRRPIFRTGDPVTLCSTNNTLIRAAVLAKVPGFDEQFNMTGGEDTHFFLRVREFGFRMVFSAEAVVYEPITEARANVPWLLRRGYQSGNSWALCERNLQPRESVTRGFKGLAHMFRGFARVITSLLRGKAAIVRNLQEFCAGAGMLAGALGHRFEPYHHAGTQGTAGAKNIVSPS